MTSRDHTYVWNEDLVHGLRARHQQAWQQQRQTQYQWKQGADAVESIRKDIRRTKTGKIFNLSPKLFNKKVYEECVKIIQGEVDVEPPGFTPLTPEEVRDLKQNTVMPYVQQMGKKTGAFAILLAFHIAGKDSLSKQQICQLGQPHCSTEMEANYHSGRMFGAWKSKDTLVKHGLITEHKAGASWTPAGFRSNGKNTYSISEEGKRAIQQIFQKWPDVREQVGRTNTPGTPGTAHMEAPFHPATQRRAATRTPKKKSPKSTQDEQELLQWIQSASPGQQKLFKGAGKDRRRYLHNVCDKLQDQHPGLRLHHESEAGSGTRRDLYVTLRAKPTDMSLPPSTPVATGSSKKRQSTASTRPGQTLGGTAKKPRSASKAAASAALARFEHCNSNNSVGHSAKGITAINHPIVELLQDDSSEGDDRKPAAKPKLATATAAFTTSETLSSALPSGKPRNPRDYQPDDHCLLTTEGRTRCLILRVHTSGHVTIMLPTGHEQKVPVRDIEPCPDAIAVHQAYKRKEVGRSPAVGAAVKPKAVQSATVAKKPPRKSSKTERVIDLCDEEEEDSPSIRTRSVKLEEAKTPAASNNSQLIVLIDDRERSRNHKPRELRIELAKELQSKSFQIEGTPTATVEEHKLHYGDFAFVEANGERRERLSVVVERKRVADLVQRSAYGDHWKQLTRMIDCCQHAIILIEGDSKVACRFDAFGSQSMEPRAGQHTIESNADVFLFMGRAILLSPRIKFVQTQDARRTFRSVGAIGLMAHTSTTVGRNAPLNAPFSATEQKKLSDLLTGGGIHWKVAKEVAFQFGNENALQSAFDACSTVLAKEALLQPILQNMGDRIQPPGSRTHWSKAIFTVFSASKKVREAKRQSYDDIVSMVGKDVCDPAVLLCSTYANESPDAALNSAMDHPASDENKRQVTIVISKAFGPCFDEPTDSSFYSLRVTDDGNPWRLPFCQLSTSSGNLQSAKMVVFLLEGSRLVQVASDALQEDGRPRSSTEVASALATKWNNFCQMDDESEGSRRILLVRGLGPAIEKAAKAASYLEETAVLCDMIFAALMMEHGIVVLEAVRKKQEETTAMLRQLALACYQFQLLQHEHEHQ